MNNARDWRCAGNVGYVARNLFQNTGDDAQLFWKIVDPSSPYFGQLHTIAVGATNTIGSHDTRLHPRAAEGADGQAVRESRSADG